MELDLNVSQYMTLIILIVLLWASLLWVIISSDSWRLLIWMMVPYSVGFYILSMSSSITLISWQLIYPLIVGSIIAVRKGIKYYSTNRPIYFSRCPDGLKHDWEVYESYYKRDIVRRILSNYNLNLSRGMMRTCNHYDYNEDDQDRLKSYICLKCGKINDVAIKKFESKIESWAKPYRKKRDEDNRIQAERKQAKQDVIRIRENLIKDVL